MSAAISHLMLWLWFSFSVALCTCVLWVENAVSATVVMVLAGRTTKFAWLIKCRTEYRFSGGKYTEKLYSKQTPFAATAARVHKVDVWQICTSDISGTHSVALIVRTTSLSAQRREFVATKIKIMNSTLSSFLLFSPATESESKPNDACDGNRSNECRIDYVQFQDSVLFRWFSAIECLLLIHAAIEAMTKYLRKSWVSFNFLLLFSNRLCTLRCMKSKKNLSMYSAYAPTTTSFYAHSFSLSFIYASRIWRSAVKLQLNLLIFIWHGWWCCVLFFFYSFIHSSLLDSVACFCASFSTSANVFMHALAHIELVATSIFRTPATKTVKPIHDI